MRCLSYERGQHSKTACRVGAYLGGSRLHLHFLFTEQELINRYILSSNGSVLKLLVAMNSIWICYTEDPESNRFGQIKYQKSIEWNA